MTNQDAAAQAAARNEELHVRLDNDLGYHAATAKTGPMHDAVRTNAREFGHWLIDNVPPGRELATALTMLQQCSMWANAAIAVNLSPLDDATRAAIRDADRTPPGG